MCRRVTCSKCGKATWAGCGMHIESALAGVKPEDRCTCGKFDTKTASKSSQQQQQQQQQYKNPSSLY